jgi:spermidine synthase
MNQIVNGWFSEINSMWPGQSFSLEVEKILFQGNSKYQNILVFKSKTYGNVLVLDGVIQATEKDEFAYQEMLAHLPLFSHPNPKKVLIIGGGDGGIVREVTKHKCIEEIILCEIDEMVIDISKKFLPGMTKGFNDYRVKIHLGDGCAFLKEKKGEFDVIIVDSSDPIGPAETLFQQSFYQYLREGLKEPYGIICTQAECQWLHLDLIKNLLQFSKKYFKYAEYAYTTIPSYPCGQIGFLIASLYESCKIPKRNIDKEIELKYYNSEIHTASFILPEFAKKSLYSNE